MSSLKAQLDALGIEDDARWSDETRRRKIADATSHKGIEPLDPVDGPSDAAKSGAPMTDDGKKLPTEATPKAAKEPEIPVTLEADYWAAEDERIPAGSNVNLRKSEATRLIDQGKAKRNDPLPG